MTQNTRDILAAFETLSPTEKHKVAVEILRLMAKDDNLPEAGLAELADELFQSYDAEQASGAER